MAERRGKADVSRVRLDALEPAPWNINEMDEETFLALLDDMNQKDGPHRINPIRAPYVHTITNG